MKVLSTLIMLMAWLVCFALSYSMSVVFSHEVYQHAQNFVLFVKILPILMAISATIWWYLILKNK